MTEADIVTVETRLGLTLPEHYRRFLMEYPQTLIDTKLDLGWVQEAPADRQLYNNAARLAELNRDVRLPGTPWGRNVARRMNELSNKTAFLAVLIFDDG